MRLTTLLIVALSTLLVACNNGASAELLLEKQWKLISIDNQPLQLTSTLTVDAQQKATGKLACNNFFGTLAVQDNKVRIDKMGTTRKSCVAAVNSVEALVSNTLTNWSEIKISGEKLILTGAEHTLTYTIK